MEGDGMGALFVFEILDDCRQCGKAKPDNGFVICGECYDRNAKYLAEDVEKLRRSSRGAWHRNKDSGMFTREYRDRRVRSVDEYVHDFESKGSAKNSRTEYHGGNYRDE